jgi:ABC-type polysaccharide/polyol phosphate transport system ATPase subunit
VNGRISPLFTLAPGWDPEDTGYENIMNCGLFFGMSWEEIEEKTPEIAEVSGLGSYLDLPARTYSAGMQTRLAFAIATSIDPGVVVLDEGLSAGDASFADTATKRVDSLLSRTRILILASHSMDLLQRWCNTAILLERGRIVCSGSVAEVSKAYQNRQTLGTSGQAA